MSNYTIQKLPGEPILIGATHPEWTPEVDIPIWADDAYHVLDSQTEPVFYIADVLAGQPWTLDELIRTANAVARGEKPVFHHPNVREVLMVTHQALVSLAVKGLQADVFGHVKTRVFGSLDDALAYARSK